MQQVDAGKYRADQLRDLTWLCNKAQLHFREIMKGDDNFALDLEFKVDKENRVNVRSASSRHAR
ncbi:MAG: hypothetical protein P8Z78_12680 [Gammaproteobacteria bacterium]|jgi:hypothetical protein